MTIHLLTFNTHAARKEATRLSYDGYTSTWLDRSRFAGEPNPRRLLRTRIKMMLEADAVVILQELTDRELADLVATCRATAIRLIHLQDLPLPAPDTFPALDRVSLCPPPKANFLSA